MSLTILSLVVGVIATILKGAGIEATPESIETAILTIVQVISAFGVYWGRYRMGDISLLGKRK